MQKVNSLCTDSRPLRAEYCIVVVDLWAFHHLVITVFIWRVSKKQGKKQSEPDLFNRCCVYNIKYAKKTVCLSHLFSNFYRVRG